MIDAPGALSRQNYPLPTTLYFWVIRITNREFLADHSVASLEGCGVEIRDECSIVVMGFRANKATGDQFLKATGDLSLAVVGSGSNKAASDPSIAAMGDWSGTIPESPFNTATGDQPNAARGDQPNTALDSILKPFRPSRT